VSASPDYSDRDEGFFRQIISETDRRIISETDRRIISETDRRIISETDRRIKTGSYSRR